MSVIFPISELENLFFVSFINLGFYLPASASLLAPAPRAESPEGHRTPRVSLWGYFRESIFMPFAFWVILSPPRRPYNIPPLQEKNIFDFCFLYIYLLCQRHRCAVGEIHAHFPLSLSPMITWLLFPK